jgi:hypothetical protein
MLCRKFGDVAMRKGVHAHVVQTVLTGLGAPEAREQLIAKRFLVTQLSTLPLSSPSLVNI